MLDALGVRRWSPALPRQTPIPSDVLAAVGAALSSGAFWRGLSARAARYVRRRLEEMPAECAQLRELPAGNRRFGDLFAPHVFRPLAGAALPYLADLPELAALGHEDVRAALGLLVHTTTASASLKHALKLAAAASAGVEVFAALYKVCEDPPAVAEAIFVGKEALACAEDCVWDDDVDLAELCAAEVLAPRYATFGLESFFLRLGVPPRVHRPTDFVTLLVSLSRKEVPGAWRLVHDALSRFHPAGLLSCPPRDSGW